VSNHTDHKSFIFSEKIDKDLLASLYEDDFPYMEEIFSITLSQLKPDINQLKAAFDEANIEALKKAVHKLKPSFGFIGLPQVQEQCKEFEDACGRARSLETLAASYKQLVKELEESIIIIESEHKRLQDYNLSQL
jgi:HPt (histidine-containing phosphotransfer) domain-containing protein